MARLGMGRNLVSMSECVPNLSDLSLGESTGSARVPRDRTEMNWRVPRPGAESSDIRRTLREPPVDDDGPPVIARLPNYLNGIDRVVRGLVSGRGMTYTLVDGRNVLYKTTSDRASDVALKEGVIQTAKTCLPAGGTQVVVVWSKWDWDNATRVPGGNRATRARQKMLRAKQIACLFEPLRRRGTKIVFALIQYPPLDYEDGEYCMESCRKGYEKHCTLPNMGFYTHLACELDDALLTALHCELLRNSLSVGIVSGDRKILKTDENMGDLQYWIDNTGPDFEVVTQFVEVDVDGCASSSESTA